MKSIAVFIPIFNGGFYLRDTLQTVLNQTYKNFKIYCVNDSSTDNSLEIIQEFALKDRRVLFFTKEQGHCTAKSWNFILPKIKEDFLFYMSQDDMISTDVFEKMINRQAETNADCILPDMIVYYKDNPNNKKVIGLNGDRSIILTGIEAVQKSLKWEIHGFALRKKELYDGEYFFSDAFDTDEYMTRKIFFNSKKVAFSSGSFLYRQDNPTAITKGFTSKNYYSLLTYFRVYSLLLKSDKLKSKRINWFNFIIKSYSLRSQNFKDKKEIYTKEQEKEIGLFLKKIYLRLLIHILFRGRFWSTAILIKEHYKNKMANKLR